jgi:hypothetical protein
MSLADAIRIGRLAGRDRRVLPRLAKPRVDEPTPDKLIGLITGSTAISGAVWRWIYGWAEAEIQLAGGAYTFATMTGGRTGSALNVTEAGNTAVVVANGVLVLNLPPLFEVKPVVGFVELTRRYLTSGVPIWTFSAPVIDGECTGG